MTVSELIEILKTVPVHYEVKHLDLECGYELEITDNDIVVNKTLERVLIG